MFGEWVNTMNVISSWKHSTILKTCATNFNVSSKLQLLGLSVMMELKEKTKRTMFVYLANGKLQGDEIV